MSTLDEKIDMLIELCQIARNSLPHKKDDTIGIIEDNLIYLKVDTELRQAIKLIGESNEQQ